MFYCLAILSGPVAHGIQVETPKYIKKTNTHFTVTLTDTQVAQVRATMRKWRDAPGKYYDLDTRNCIHFVGAMAPALLVRLVRKSDMFAAHMRTSELSAYPYVKH